MTSASASFDNSTVRFTCFAVLFAVLLIPSAVDTAHGQEQDRYRSLTDSLVKTYNRLWDRQDIAGMDAMLTDDAVFLSPFQMRVSRDTIRATVFAKNPQRFHDTWSEEDFSSIDGNNAYSIGRMGFNVYNRDGKKTGSTEAQYVMTFVRHSDNRWRVKLIIVPKANSSPLR
jgi:uncharacterized protein (TIGR02246 family)